MTDVTKETWEEREAKREAERQEYIDLSEWFTVEYDRYIVENTPHASDVVMVSTARQHVRALDAEKWDRLRQLEGKYRAVIL